ncbi:MAG: TolC family protein, partial [Candidatus Binatia bacterium]
MAALVVAASVVTGAEERPQGRGESAAARAGEALNLRQALALTLTSSPELAPFSLELRAAEARVLQAGLLPNPAAELTIEDVLGSGRFEGGREAQVTLQLSQLVELGGKRRARVDVASRRQDLAAADYEAKRVEVLAEVTKRFVDVLERQQSLELAQERVELDEASLEAVRRRARAGAGSPLEDKRASVA